MFLLELYTHEDLTPGSSACLAMWTQLHSGNTLLSGVNGLETTRPLNTRAFGLLGKFCASEGPGFLYGFRIRCRSKLIPLSIYGDEVTCYKGSEVGTVSVLAWSSDFGWGADSMTRYWPICVFSEADAVEFTMHDVFEGLVPHLRQMFDAAELHPWSGEGYHFMLSSLQGDLKWIHECYGLNNFRSKQFCAWCGCSKVHERIGMTLGYFYEDAEYWHSEPDLEEFERKACPIFHVPGASIRRVLHDVCHGQLLGTGKCFNGGALVYLAERNCFGQMDGPGEYATKLETFLRTAHVEFVQWQKANKCRCSQPRFTVARVCRRTRMSFAALQSKAVSGKTVSYWLVPCLPGRHFQRP